MIVYHKNGPSYIILFSLNCRHVMDVQTSGHRIQIFDPDKRYMIQIQGSRRMVPYLKLYICQVFVTTISYNLAKSLPIQLKWWSLHLCNLNVMVYFRTQTPGLQNSIR